MVKKNASKSPWAQKFHNDFESEHLLMKDSNGDYTNVKTDTLTRVNEICQERFFHPKKMMGKSVVSYSSYVTKLYSD